MSNTTIEIIGGRERRRRWSVEEKLRIVAETHEPGASVRAVAARHDVYPNLLRTWRRQVREGRLVAALPDRFMPVRVAETAPTTPGIAPLNRDPAAAAETVEIVLPDGLRVRVGKFAGRTKSGRLWSYLRDDRPFAGKGGGAVLLQPENRKGEHPRTISGRSAASCKPMAIRAMLGCMIAA